MGSFATRPVAVIARTEWQLLWRRRVALVAMALALVLTSVATLVSVISQQAIEDERARFESIAEQQWKGQPDRHPHRVAHYGHFVFRPLEPLAFFDFGVDPYTGRSVYLEAHRQNAANFSDARQSSALLRFGQLTPAYVIQTLLPLLIIFFSFGSLAGEREGGQLRLVLSQGVRGSQLVAGKLACHALLALVLCLPAFGALLVAGAASEGQFGNALWMSTAYALYLVMWAALSVGASAWLPRARDALLVLVALWVTTTMLLPRMLPELAQQQLPSPTRIETDIAVKSEAAKAGDTHNPQDPYFQAFRERVLAQYGVSRVEDLPVNYGALVLAEGERLTSEIYVRHQQALFDLQNAQLEQVRHLSVLSPVIGLRQVSMAAAGTDLASHQRFLAEAERYRYALIQSLNELHKTEVRYENDRAQRIGQHHWQQLPRFDYAAPLTRHADLMVGTAVLAGWLCVLLMLLRLLGRRMEVVSK